MQVTLEQYLGTILESAVTVHILHLQTHGYSKHMALDEFYKEAPEKADAICEHTLAIQFITQYENVLPKTNYQNPLDYLQALRAFVVEGRKMLYNPDTNSNIYSDIDDFMSLIDEAIYKVSQLYEGLDDSVFNQSEAEKQYIAGILTYNGQNVKNFFQSLSADISKAIEARLGKDYRCVTRNYAAIYYSKVTKLFVTVFESYKHGFYAAAAMPMIPIASPEILTQTTLFPAGSAEEITDYIQKFAKSYKPIYINR